jgi:hypothetical protein
MQVSNSNESIPNKEYIQKLDERLILTIGHILFETNFKKRQKVKTIQSID